MAWDYAQTTRPHDTVFRSTQGTKARKSQGKLKPHTSQTVYTFDQAN